MCKLIIEQPDYQKIELEFDDVVEASTTVEHIKQHAVKDTTFTIICEIVNKKGEQHDI